MGEAETQARAERAKVREVKDFIAFEVLEDVAWDLRFENR